MGWMYMASSDRQARMMRKRGGGREGEDEGWRDEDGGRED